MTTDIELLPLPEPMRVLGTRGKDAAEAWCRANVAHATAAKDAEIERLREDAERYRFLRAEALSAFESGLNEPQLVFARECVGDYQDCIDAATDAAREAHNG